MSVTYTPQRTLRDKRQVNLRKRYMAATFVTCMVLTFIGGTLHVLKLGENRMNDMRSRVTYDIADARDRQRAAGQDLFIEVEHQYLPGLYGSYTVEEAEALLTPEQWREIGTMIEIPAGPYAIGTSMPRADLQNQPEHVVEMAAYRIAKYPITNAQYARFVAATKQQPPMHWTDGRITPGLELHPVAYISWFHARRYAEWAGMRLPTEVEWERAARGPEGWRWPWGNRMDPARLNTYYRVGSTTEVTLYEEGASSYGVMDMTGNVAEWVDDDFLPYPGTPAPEHMFYASLPAIPDSASLRALSVAEFVPTNERYKVIRGGSWKSDPFSTSAFHRNFSLPNYASDFFGFRVAQDVE